MSSYVHDALSCADMLQRALHVFREQRCVGWRVRPGVSRDRGQWVDVEHFKWVTYAEVHTAASRLACSLCGVVGVQRGEFVGILAPNGLPWLIADFACCWSDAVSVGLHTSWSGEALLHVVDDAQLVAIVATVERWDSLVEAVAARGGGGSLRAAVLMDATADQLAARVQGAEQWGMQLHSYALQGAKQHEHQCRTTTGCGALLGDAFTAEYAPPPPGHRGAHSEPYTLMYSSGTTGMPKGIVVSKGRWKLDALSGGVAALDPKVAVSHMALAHGGDRGVAWQTLMCGGALGFADSSFQSQLLRDLQSIRPRFLLGMSHFWARLHSDYLLRLHADMAAALRGPMEACIRAQLGPELVKSAGLGSLLSLATQSNLWDRVIRAARGIASYQEVYERCVEEYRMLVGDQSLVKAVTGGAHTSPEVLEFMRLLMADGNESGVFNAYGSTEFPGISVNGQISPSIDLKLVDVQLGSGEGFTAADVPHPRGEIWVRSKDAHMTKAYWKRPLASAEVWTDGWYRTGDVGLLERVPGREDPLLHVVDRVKNLTEMYVGGESVWAPLAELEETVYASCSAVHRVFLVADRNQPYPVAVVVPHRDFVRGWLSRRGMLASQGVVVEGQHHAPAVFTDPALASEVLAQLQLLGRARRLKPHEVPQAVCLEACAWTVANGFLTPVGKLKRSALKQRYLGAVERAYAQLETRGEAKTNSSSSSSSSWEGNGLPEQLPSLTRALSSPALDAEASQSHAGIGLALDVLVAQLHVQAASERKEGLLAQQPVAIDRWVSDFEFVGRNEADSARLARAWHAYRALGLAKRAGIAAWQAEGQARVEARTEELAHSTATNRAAVDAALHSLEKADAARVAAAYYSPSRDGSGQRELKQTHVYARLDALCVCLERFKLRVSAQWQRVGHAGSGMQPPDCNRNTHEFNAALRELQIVAAACRVRVPWQLVGTIQWVFPPVEGEDSPGIPIGDAKVWCDICGTLIEETAADEGAERLHCLDCSDKDVCGDCFRVVSRALELVAGWRSAGVGGAEQAWGRLTDLFPHHAHALSRDSLHTAHLQDRCKVYLKAEETPAGLITSACQVYADRPALGIPNVVALAAERERALSSGGWGAEADSHSHSHSHSPLAAAAGLSLRTHDGFDWLTYRQLGRLSARVARGLAGLGAGGRFVAVCGYNSFEWAVADFAAARAGAGVVGIHATYSKEVILRVLRICRPHVLVVHSDMWLPATTRDPRRKGLWSVVEVAGAAHAFLKHIVVADLGAEQTQALLDRPEMKGRSIPQAVHSMPEWVAHKKEEKKGGEGEGENEGLPDPYSVRGVSLASADGQPMDVFTLLYTSGSSGTPKAVMVSAESFCNDVCERSFASPLVSVSFIPLSHSSDRMKLWEFMGNGGRIGFAHYAASNWASHERGGKKDALLGSLDGGLNDVLSLLHQVRLLRPSALSFPPRIWNGLYSMFRRELGAAQARAGQVAVGEGGDSAEGGGERERLLLRGRVAWRASINVVKAWLGDRVRFLATGGAPTSEAVKAFARSLFHDKAGVSFVDSYGTTESGAVLYNGKVCSSKGVQVKLAPLPRMGADSSNTPTNSSSRAPTAPQEHEGGSLCSVGELWVKSPNLSLGYYGDPQATRESFRADGWYRTGDLAKYDSALDTYVILERVSAVRQRRDGSLVFPTRLEALYAHCPLVQQVLVHLDASSEVLTALVVPTTHTLGHTEDGSSREEEEEHTRERVLAEIVSLHASAGAAGDAPSRVVLAHAPFSQGNGLMTGTLKLRRVRIQERYADALATQQ